jgi:hypothetical protein
MPQPGVSQVRGLLLVRHLNDKKALSLHRTWRNTGKDLDPPPDCFDMSPNGCLPHSLPCPAGGTRPSSALGICRSHKFAIGHWKVRNFEKCFHGMDLCCIRERERTIFERSRSSFKVLDPLISANLVCDWGAGWKFTYHQLQSRRTLHAPM